MVIEAYTSSIAKQYVNFNKPKDLQFVQMIFLLCFGIKEIVLNLLDGGVISNKAGLMEELRFIVAEYDSKLTFKFHWQMDQVVLGGCVMMRTITNNDHVLHLYCACFWIVVIKCLYI